MPHDQAEVEHGPQQRPLSGVKRSSEGALSMIGVCVPCEPSCPSSCVPSWPLSFHLVCGE